MNNDNHSSGRFIGEEQHPSKRFFSYSFTALTVLASVVTIAPAFTQFAPLPAQAGISPLPPAPPVVFTSVAPHAVPEDAQACKLESTKVSAKVSGYTARVTVTQVFSNPNNSPFDATYSFPLADESAVDEMTMKIGNRVIVGKIKKKEEARAIYEAARASGQSAALLEQQRTNIFTQSVANVAPHEKIEVTLKYTDILAYNNGKYDFVFPTKIGPRFTPSGFEQPDRNTSTAPTPIAMDLDVDGGMPIHDIRSKLHGVHFSNVTTSGAHVACNLGYSGDDFVLSWETAENAIKTGVQVHHDREGGYLTAMVMPPKKVTREMAQPKELVFLLDCSGSQSGLPIDKAKETLHYIVEHMNPRDTFQIVSFNSSISKLAEEPLLVNAAMKQKAHEYIESLTADGGTWMGPAVEEVCSKPAPENRLRIVTMMTDGFISNDYEIINMVKRLRGSSRWFPYGTGNSVNRTLIDGVAKEGGGEADYILLNEDGKKVAEQFYKRISNPVLTDVKVSFEGVQVEDVYPKQVSDVWDQKPLYFHAKYRNGGRGTMTISGFSGGQRYIQTLPVVLPSGNVENTPVAQTWARAKIDDLMSKDYEGKSQGVQGAITEVALKHHLMSQYTSFVAVDGAQSYADRAGDESTAQNFAAQSFAAPLSTSAAAPSTPWYVPGFMQSTLSQSFSTTVQQLNCLNAYSAAAPTPAAACTYTPPSVPVQTQTDQPNLAPLQLLALAIMWFASLHLLFGKKRKSAVQ